PAQHRLPGRLLRQPEKMGRVQRQDQRLAVEPLGEHTGRRRGEGLGVEYVCGSRKTDIARHGAEGVQRPTHRELPREPRPHHADPVRDLEPRRARHRPGHDHSDLVTQSDQLPAQVVRVALEPTYLRREVDALLEHPHAPASQSVSVRGEPVSAWTITSAIRSPALPSPYGFAARAIRWRAVSSPSSRCASSNMRRRLVPTSRATPASIPSGRSVTSRRTRTGVPKLGASSWIPPESVSTRTARRSAATRSG